MLEAPARRYRDASLSPDGWRVALSIPQGKTQDIWIYDIANHTLNRLTFEAQNQKPFWTPDGKRVIFFTSLGGQATEQRLYWKPADGSGAAERLLEDNVSIYAAISPDGKTLAYTPRSSAGLNGGIWTVSIGGDRKPAALISASAQELSPAFSPNGDYIAYTAFEGGTRAAYVQPYPPTGGRWQVSAFDNGLEPQWSRDGKKLFYRAGNTIMVVPIETKPSFKAGAPQKFVSDLTPAPGAVKNYSVAPDGRRLLLTRPAEKTAASSEVVVIVNWGEELRRLAPNRR
jgi:Tol biopolymer transport system component